MGSTGDTLLLGTRKGLLRYRRVSSGWKLDGTSHVGQPVSYAWHDRRTGSLWTGIDHGHWGQKLSRSGDGGETWDAVEPPKYPDGAVYRDAFAGPDAQKDKPATLSLQWVITGGGADRPERIYIGTEPGGLFRSEDNGESFALVEGLWNHPSRLEHWFGGGRDRPAIHSILVDPADSAHLYVGISCAGVFETTDDGETWAPRNLGLRAEFLPNPTAEVGHDPHFMDWCDAQPSAMWQQNHCGIFKSVNAGAEWTAVSQAGNPAHFGFAVAADQRCPETAWVVPGLSDEQRIAVDGALCVCRTEDGGASWTALRQGLPQSECYDIVFRHGLDNDGDRLAFGSTTGNAYFSEDRGESWLCLGNHLPPIYSVRFAQLG